ncbi:L,D-transpeptidase family protein [Thermohalobacter berrensis]|uniref:L,D-transpeptidase family protein n=1 Tax=Thermohalobacter berrensis TaxID=99594 RepID=UPI0026D81658
MRRFTLILFSFICILIVIIVGNKITLYLKNQKVERKGIKFVTSQYEKWEEEKLKENKDYNLGILIDIDRKYLYLIDMKKNKLIKRYVVATGRPSSPSPIGSYKIIEKAKWGGGFGSRWMRINVPWGKYGIHGTNKPGSIGYNASHGCIRMRNKDVEELYSLVKYNTPVVLIKGSYGPFGHGFRTLRPGDRGADVREVQRVLKEKEYYYGALDGIYGNGMKAALIRFLKENNMPITDRIGYTVYKKLGIILMD